MGNIAAMTADRNNLASSPVVFAFGGVDPGGRAGLAADLATLRDLGAEPRPIVTAITAQNDAEWLGSWPTSPDQLRLVLQSLQMPSAHAAIKFGMLGSVAIGKIALQWAQYYDIPLIVDPMRAASSGGGMWPDDDEASVLQFLRDELFASATVITPNWPELQWIVGEPLHDLAAAENALRQLPCNAILKGGHAPQGLLNVDIVFDGQQFTHLPAQRSWPSNVRGTGCRFASAVAVCLARGDSLAQAALTAKAHVAAQAWGVGAQNASNR